MSDLMDKYNADKAKALRQRQLDNVANMPKQKLVQPDLINLTHRAQVSAAIDATERFMDFLTSLPLDADYLGEALQYKYRTIKELEES